MEKPDPYGEWVLHKSNEAKGGIPHPVDEQLLAAARAAWPAYWPTRSEHLPRKTQRQKQKLSQQKCGREY